MWKVLALLLALWPVPTVASDGIERVEVEERRIKDNFFQKPPGPIPMVVYRVVLKAPIDEPQFEVLAAQVRKREPSNAIVGLRFVFGDYPRANLDPEGGQPYYAWKLFWPGREDITNFSGTSPGRLAKLIADLKLLETHRLVGVWIDHYQPLGAVALIQTPKELHYLMLDDPKMRWTMRPQKRPVAGRHFVAQEMVLASGDRYRADGNGADKLGVSIMPDNTLHVFGGRQKLPLQPWMIAKPVTLPRGNGPESRP
jgi:hypothetical protein